MKPRSHPVSASSELRTFVGRSRLQSTADQKHDHVELDAPLTSILVAKGSVDKGSEPCPEK